MLQAVSKLRRKARSQWFYKVEMRRLAEAAESGPAGVELRHWRPRHGRNFGDELSVAIVEQLLALQGRSLEFAIPAPRRLHAVGSILQRAQDGDTVWGSGVNGRDVTREPGFRRLDVRAVRGPLTRDYLARWRPEIEVPAVFGDPGLLVYDLFPDLATRRSLPAYPEVIVIPNLNDLRMRSLNTDLPVISPLIPWPLMCEYIAQARAVISSSLHGFVLGERLGKDVKLVRFSDHEPIFKYEDYVLGSGRESGPRVFDSVEAARRVDMTAAPVLPPAGLREAFPHDLWAA